MKTLWMTVLMMGLTTLAGCGDDADTADTSTTKATAFESVDNSDIYIERKTIGYGKSESRP